MPIDAQLTLRQESAPVRGHSDEAPANMLQAVMQAVRDKTYTPGELQQLLEIGIQLEARDAKMQFNRAMQAMRPELPVIQKNGTIIYPGKDGRQGGRTKFAKWDDIHRACMPILDRFGFSISFSSELQGSNALRVAIRVKHTAGHEEEGALTVPWLDTGGAKTPAQAAASSETLAQRHAFCKYFNILTVDQDTDGTGAAPDRITEAQALKIEDIVTECDNR